MSGLEPILSLTTRAGGLWAYGPAPGVELIPYFLWLVLWVGSALLAILLAPFSALLRRLRKTKSTAPPELKNEGTTEKTM
jgi:hypothetical protein